MNKPRGEATDRRGLWERLAGLGVRPGDPGRGGRIGEVYLMLTMRCNLRCRACTLWGVGGACQDPRYRAEISRPAPRAAFSSLLEQLVPYRPRYVNFSGGEPLLSPLCLPLAARAKELGFSTILTTNGVYIERFADRVAESFDQLNLSVACPPALREELRMGPPGHYEAMVRGLRGMVRRRKRPLLRLLCEVFDSNAGHIGELVEHLKAKGIEFDEILFQHLIFNPPKVLAAQERAFREEFGLPLGMWKGYGYRPRIKDFASFARALRDLGARYPQARFTCALRGPQDARDYYQGRRRRLGAAFCDGPWTQVHVLPNGDVWTCPDYILGNIARDGFAGIWDGKKARALRRRVMARLFPACRGCFLFYGKEQPLGVEEGGR
ncbi:MAG: SPASM domain-containing protein [Elusimicrobia bacterium]|nr:SPASM domain-containing protein [Elusimicrobiota bacterium]